MCVCVCFGEGISRSAIKYQKAPRASEQQIPLRQCTGQEENHVFPRGSAPSSLLAQVGFQRMTAVQSNKGCRRSDLDFEEDSRISPPSLALDHSDKGGRERSYDRPWLPLPAGEELEQSSGDLAPGEQGPTVKMTQETSAFRNP